MGTYWYPKAQVTQPSEEELPDLHNLPENWRPQNAYRNNGPNDLALERFKLRELAEGFAMYRDACEWENLESIFHPSAYIYTTWTGRIHHHDFIQATKRAMDHGVLIMHRCHGCTTDINTTATRAVTKMKATISQRFDLNGYEIDVDVDCRLCFFWEKVQENIDGINLGEWRAMLVRHWYEKDKATAVNPEMFPHMDKIKLATMPQGYRYLAYCQEATMGVKVMKDMPGHISNGESPNGKAHNLLYLECKKWIDGEDIYI